MADETYSAEQVEILLRCPVCLDRYTNPKILPCQHTFCKSPCLEGLIEYGSRRVKCPECRKEHYVPYSGVNGFPTNITLSAFLDLPTQPAQQHQQSQSQSVEQDYNDQEAPAAEAASTANKCGVCELEAETAKCFHCNKLVCESCKRSHTGQMKFDLGRLINQIRRGVPKLSHAISHVEEKSEQVRQQVEGVKAEIKTTVERYVKELRDKEKMLNSELDTFLQGESRSLRLQQENFEVELASISSYADSMEGMLNQSSTDIPEADMVDMKRQCLEYLQQIRNVENSNPPECRHVVFQFDGNGLQSSIVNFGEVCIVTPSTSSSTPRQATSQNTVGDGGDTQGISNRSRWSEPQSLDAVYLSSIASNASPSPEPQYLSAQDILHQLTPRSTSYRPQAQERSTPVRSMAYRPAGFMGSDMGGLNRPTRTSYSSHAHGHNYMYRMDTSTDNIQQMLQQMREQEVPSRPAHWNTTARFGHEPVAPGERMGGFMTGGAGGGGTTPRHHHHRHIHRGNHTPAVTATRPPAVVRPAAAFVVPLDTDSRNGGRRRGTCPHGHHGNRRQTEMRRNAAAAAEARARSTNNAVDGEGNRAASTGSSTTNTSNGAAASDGTSPSASSSAIGPPPLQRQGTFTREDGPSNAEATPAVGGDSTRGIPADAELHSLDIDSDIGQAVPPAPNTYRVMNQHIEQYQTKGDMVRKLGGQRGPGRGKFNSPRGVAISPINENIVVADSSNHRVQLFAANGQLLSMFGSYGQGDGEFDCLAGVAVNTMGEIIIADRYNHRIQVFDRNGHFSHKFGSEGSGDGQLNYPWGLAVDCSGFIYVCDKENHRIQVFQQNGTFVRKFGQLGSNLGQFENPHYVAISPENKVIVSDTNNHRIQIFNTSGRLLQAFGTEGSAHGRLKNPKGVAVDSQGFIIVADSGNNRVQVHRPNGMFACCFGTAGQGNGQFNGLEGVCLMPNGNIAVCDRDNHRIQLF